MNFNRDKNKLFRGINEPERVVDMWRDMGHMSNLSKLDKRGLKHDFFRQKTADFYGEKKQTNKPREEKRGCR